MRIKNYSNWIFSFSISDCYHCGNEDCSRETFENALELFFKCPSCGQVLNLKKNEKIRKNFSKKIDQIKGDLRV